jgi:hypothetical protein
VTAPHCTLITAGGVPRVVEQALDDVQLPPVARLMMWHLAKRLDLFEYREVKNASIAAEMRVKETTAGQMLALLVSRGYLDQKNSDRRTRAFRLLWSRRQSKALAA